MPFLLEDRMKECGGDYTAGEDWAPHAGAGGRSRSHACTLLRPSPTLASPCPCTLARPPILTPLLHTPSPPPAVADGQLITGQNPGSSKRVAELVIEAVAPGLKEPVHGKGPGEGLHHR